MKCPCCGKEITSSDRFCPNCGENNEGYIEVVQYQRKEEQPYVNQPINRVPLNQNNTNPDNNSTVFVHHQTQVVYTTPKEGKGIGVCAIIFSVLGGWLGLALAIIGLITYKERQNKILCLVALGIFMGWVILYLALIIGVEI